VIHTLTKIFFPTKVVLTLMEDLLHERHCVYIDNWYTSVEVCDILNNNTTDAVGTLRRDRRGLPKEFVKEKLKQGERIVWYKKNKGLEITHWKDKRDVFMMTTCIPDGESQVQTCGKEAEIPTVVQQLCKRSDDNVILNRAKRVKMWYKKDFTHLTNISVFNSQILHKKERRYVGCILFP